MLTSLAVDNFIRLFSSAYDNACPNRSSAGTGLAADTVVPHTALGVALIVRRSVGASDEDPVTFAQLVFAAACWVLTLRALTQLALEPVPRVAATLQVVRELNVCLVR